jgi:hypothetical protein
MESHEDEAFNAIERQAKQRKESVRAALQYPQKDIDWQREQQIKAQASTPPQRKWVGLTDEEMLSIEETTTCTKDESWLRNVTRAIEAKLKEKNT